MSYSVINEGGEIVIKLGEFDPDMPDNHYTHSISNVLTIKQARAFARSIYAYCRIAEKEKRR